MSLNLEDLIPHRPPMVLISRMRELNEERAIGEVDITETSMFFENGHVPAWIGIEYVAQTIAAYSGHLGRFNGGGPAIGLLLGARRYRSTVDGFKAGQTLQVKVEPVLIDGDMGSFKGTIAVEGETVAEVTMTTYKPDEATLRKLKNGTGDAHV